MRKFTNMILEMVDEGLVYEKDLIRDLLNWMPEADVQEFYEKNFAFEPDEEEEDEDSED